jgi:hypothetical protein
MPLSPNVRFLRASLVLTFHAFLLSEAISRGVVIPRVSSSLGFGATNPLASFARQPLSYRRFPTAVEAIRLAVEDFPAICTLGAWMRVGDDHFDGEDIRPLREQ